MIKNDFFTLNNGVKIPAIGFGTWQVADGEEGYNSCLAALKSGYPLLPKRETKRS